MAGRYRARCLAGLALSAAAALAVLLSGCGADTGLGAAPPCLPPEYSVSPTEARPGQAVTVAAGDADCNPRYGSNARIEVTVVDASGAEIVDATVPMNDGGGFTYAFVIPEQAAAGEAAVTAMPRNIDWCDDTGRNNRVATVAGDQLERAACALPLKPLTITHPVKRDR